MPPPPRPTDDELDDDSVALILNQPPPRLAKFGAVDYVQLSNVDSSGVELPRERSEQIHDAFVASRHQVRRLMLRVFALVFALILATFAILQLLKFRETPTKLAYVLTKPLNRTKLGNGTHTFDRSTLVISLDGMHPHYVSPDRTPNLHQLAKGGFAPPYITPSFPTQTFPNHWTLVTGNYPINHGIVGNTFFDSDLEWEFVNTNAAKSRNREFWGGEPIWKTMANHNLSTVVHMWPGSEANWAENECPTERSEFDQHESLSEKTARIVSWLDRVNIPHVMLAYVPNVDQVGHRTGITGPSLQAELMAVDAFIGDIVTALHQRNLTEVVNLVVLSDHGMAPVSDERLVRLDDVIVNYDNVTSNYGWPLAGLRFTDESQLALALASAQKNRHTGCTVYASDDLPGKWNFRTSKLESTAQVGRYANRLAPLYVVPDVTYQLVSDSPTNNLKGVHGYDSQAPLMRALFLAQGPAFPGGRYHPFPNTDVYSAICRSVGVLEAASSDGDFEGVPLKKKLGKENYPGVSSVADYFLGSSFDDYYE